MTAATGAAHTDVSTFPLIRRFLILSIISSVAFDFSLKTTLAIVLGGTVAILSYGSFFGPSTHHATTNTDASQHVSATTRSSNGQNLPPCSRQPEHCVTTAVSNGSNVLRDGVIAFAHTRQPHAEASSPTISPSQRLSRLMTALLVQARSRSPPPKGSTILISLPHATLDCPHQAAALATLASHYTVIGMVVLEGESKDSKIDLDASSFPLPSHRVLCSNSPAGRIAIGRQLQPQLVLELESSIAGHLERFGHTTVVYDSSADEETKNPEKGGTSPLGRVWLQAMQA